MKLRDPYLLGAAGAPLALSVVAGSQTENAANVRRLTGLVALGSGAVWSFTGSERASAVGIGAGAAWALLKLGIL